MVYISALSSTMRTLFSTNIIQLRIQCVNQTTHTSWSKIDNSWGHPPSLVQWDANHTARGPEEQFEKCAYSLACWMLEERINTSLFRTAWNRSQEASYLNLALRLGICCRKANLTKKKPHKSTKNNNTQNLMESPLIAWTLITLRYLGLNIIYMD